MSILHGIVRFSIRQRWFVALTFFLVSVLGARAFSRLPIDAIPDITNIQVQINTAAPALAPVEVERRITIPVETAMAGLPKVEHTRSLSRYGLSQVTVVFEEGTDLHFARQLVAERLAAARESLPSGITPELGPTATGLGEIYMWTLKAEPDATRADGKPYELSDLRALEDWVVRPRIRNVPGVTEVNAIGGFEKTFRVAPEPERLMEYGVSFDDVADAITRSNGTAGGGYIERNGESQLVRASGVLETEADLRGVVVGRRDAVPVRVRDVATVSIGHDLRTGAATVDGEEAVIGTAIMLVGENSRTVSTRVRAELDAVQASLPGGVHVVTLYDRTYLVDDTIGTVEKNLLEGALLVILVLFLLLGNLRAALIVSVVIPVSMAAAVIGMLELDVSGNLMSLGAIDFGLLVDGSVIVVESSVRKLAEERHRLGRRLAKKERLVVSFEAAREVLESAVFGQLIIGAVYLPVLTLSGIEGKMFRPMAITVVLALGAATLLAMTLMPALVALTLGGEKEEKSSRLFGLAQRGYTALLEPALRRHSVIVGAAAVVLILAAGLATTLGTEFSPRLGEGAIALQPSRIPSMGLTESVALERTTERTLLKAFPDEIATVFARTGTAEVATDPMGPNVSDAIVMLRPRAGWTKARSQEELAEKISEVLLDVPGQNYEISQPIELRFNELISGVRTDVAVMVYGDDLESMLRDAQRVAALLREVPGAADVKVEQVSGLPVLTVRADPGRLSRYGLTVDDVNEVVELGIGGREVGHIFEGERRFPISIRLPESMRADDGAIDRLPIALPREAGVETATFVPLGAVADLPVEEGPNQISRENGKRRVVVQCGVRGRDLGGFVAEAREKIARDRPDREGTFIKWGGQYENLVLARERLMWVVPLALLAVLGLIYASVGTLRNALLIFTGVPLASTGGIVALSLRGIPLSISAVIGFIALSGVAVQNGLVMVTCIERLRRGGANADAAVRLGSTTRLRPVLMTALVAAIGFIPMALATGPGAEVQRPLATVVIGGILSSTLLTLVVLPALYALLQGGARADETGSSAGPPLDEEAEAEP